MLILLTVGAGTASWAPPPPPASYVDHVVLDAGHGGHDPGTHGLLSKEKDVALSIAKKVKALFDERKPGVKAELTRSADTFIRIYDRASLANKKQADLFISIHCNANLSKTVYGTETYAMGVHKEDAQLQVMMAENSAILLEEGHEQTYEGLDPKNPDSYIIFQLLQNAYLRQSLALANRVEQQFKLKARRASRGVKQAGFVVLWKASMPAILIETGFLSNPTEEKFLSSTQGQAYLAEAIYQAILTYRAEDA